MMLVRIAVSSLLALGLCGCAKEDEARILGHWRAERVKVLSLNIPISPEFVINRDELVALGTDLHIPIKSISHNGDESILNTHAGLGLSFYFENHDRMYFLIPLIGKIYYQRINDTPQDVRAIPGPPTANVSTEATTIIPQADTGQTAALKYGGRAIPVPRVSDASDVGLQRLVRLAEKELEAGNLVNAQTMLIDAKRLNEQHPMVDYNLAVLRAKQADNEAAVRHLHDAFKHGFRAFAMLDHNPDLTALKSDVRYSALVARYK